MRAVCVNATWLTPYEQQRGATTSSLHLKQTMREKTMERMRKIEARSWHQRSRGLLAMSCGLLAMFPTMPDARPPIKLFDSESDEAIVVEDQEDAGEGQGDAAEADASQKEEQGPKIRYGKQGQGSVSSTTSLDSRGEAIHPVVYRSGASTLVEVKVGGHEALMLLDTGATYTTLTPWFAKKIGANPPVGGPTSTFRTANGEMVAPFGTIGSFKLGGAQVGPVTFSLCESCGEENASREGKKIVGLLGMNVLGRYRMQMEGGVLELVEGRSHENRRVDVAPWLELVKARPRSRTRTSRSELVWELDVEIANRSKHTIKDVRLGILCETRAGVVMLNVEADRISARESVATTLEIEQEPLDCASRGVEVVDARW